MIRRVVLQIGVPALLALIVWNAYLAVRHVNQVQAMATVTEQSSALQAELSAVLRDITDMESSQRGYLLAGNPDYLQPYNEAKARIDADFGSLRSGLANRPADERSREAQMESLFQSKLAEMERSINWRERGFRLRSFKIIDTNEGKEYMDQIRGIAASLAASETGDPARMASEKAAALRKIYKVTILTNLSLLVLAVGLFGVTRRDARQLREEATTSRTELAARELQLEKLTSALSGKARSSIISIDTNSRLLLENYGDFLPRQGREFAVQMTEAAAEIERLRQDLVGNPTSSANEEAA